jgi:hypothetical protein
MMTLYCSHGLMRELGLPAGPALARSTSLLGDWYARFVAAGSGRCILAISSRSLLTVAFPLVEQRDLTTAFQQSVAHLLLRLGLGPDEVERELVLMTPTLLRSTRRADVPGRLYAAVAHARASLRSLPAGASLLDLEDRLAASPRHALLRRTPAEATLGAFRHTAEIIEITTWRTRRAAARHKL